MHAAVSILLAALLSVHSVGGLCWQCENVQDSCAECPVTTTVCNCHRTADVPTEDEICVESSSSCELECTGTCRYLQLARVTVEQFADTQWVAALPPGFEAVPSQSVFDIFERSAIARGGHPPLRLHLFHGLLLI